MTAPRLAYRGRALDEAELVRRFTGGGYSLADGQRRCVRRDVIDLGHRVGLIPEGEEPR